MASDAQLTRIHERIDDLGKDLGERLSVLAEKVTAMTTNYPVHDRRLADIETILHGPPENGSKPGLVATVRENTRAQRKAWLAVKWLATAVGAVLLTIGGAALQPVFAKVLGL